ncbi:glycoside hydrolase family 140 protein [Dyadobacter sp. CY323]|uniref:glycoside hydrolase family 140 protein n=1 Tax=Dyadobacter sp. CY323 TaxID=2907302 RepID=UPI001F3A3009|nr:glycoside hydrolase family 140 protein [Dyadobacter sp. CY323]MCE6992656.1 glycoside hydrolase family 140 protein [Dyadobacter sp. CY323]
MKPLRLSLLVLLLFSSYMLPAQTFTVSTNKRYILKEGKPFFWLGDTAWELFHRLDREDADYYLKKRASQGFTVIQAVALAEFDGLEVPNAYGEKPLVGNDPTKPNDAYFKHVDYIIDKAADYGLTIAFLPTWGDKVFKSTWGKGPEVFNEANAEVYGKWLGSRYKGKKNIIWVLGGDRNPRQGTRDVEIWKAMAAGIQAGVGGGDKALMTYHPQPNKEGSSEWFHNDEWFDFNMFQTGHCRDSPVYVSIKRSYDRQLIKPVLDGEPIYEDHPVCFNAKENGTSSAFDVRKSAYLDLFAGALGHTYGCHDIWQMYSPNREAVNGPNIFWQQALNLPGANEMKFVRKLIESRPVLDRVPDQTVVVEGDLGPHERIQASRGNDYIFIYSAAGRSFSVNPGKISGKQVTAFWYDPKNGKTNDAGAFDNQTVTKYTPPTTGYGHDWILVLDDASKNYSKPAL